MSIAPLRTRCCWGSTRSTSSASSSARRSPGRSKPAAASSTRAPQRCWRRPDSRSDGRGFSFPAIAAPAKHRDGDGDRAMHFHLPKPLHGWREFVGEVGIIVTGVLIALGAEQAVEATHHRAQVDEAVKKQRAESMDNGGAVNLSLGGLRQATAEIDRDLVELGGCVRLFVFGKLKLFVCLV